jgi:hypothetical protein
MEELIIGIEGDNGNIIDYLIDGIVIDGLYFTADFKRVTANCKNFDIEIEEPKSENIVSTKVSKRDNISILTLKFDSENQVQYLIGNDMKPNKLCSIPEEELSTDFKDMIMQAYNMTQMNRLSDFPK